MAFWPQNASVFGNSVFIDPSGDTGVVRTYHCKALAMHTGLNSGKLAKMLNELSYNYFMTGHGLLYISMALKIRLLFWFCVCCKKLIQTIFGGFRHTGAKFPELISN